MLASPCSHSASRCSPAPCTAWGIGHHRGWGSEGQPRGGGLGRGRGSSVDVVWLQLSPQRAGPRGDGRACPWCPCREVPALCPCIKQLAGTGLLLVQRVALALHSPTPAPRAARHALPASLRLSLGEKMLPAQHLSPDAGCSRDPPSVPQPTLPRGLLCVGSASGGFAPGKSALQNPSRC